MKRARLRNRKRRTRYIDPFTLLSESSFAESWNSPEDSYWDTAELGLVKKSSSLREKPPLWATRYKGARRVKPA
jgi:hypothetical protein